MALRDRLRHVDQLLAVPLRVRLEQSERGVGVDAVSLHEDSLGLLDDGPAAERPLQVVELGEAPKRDVDCALQFCGFLSIQDDVGEDTALGRFVNIAWVFGIDERDDRTRRLVNDLGDLLERMLAIEAQSDERDLCARASTERSDITDVDGASDDLMAERFDHRRDVFESVVLLVGDQHLQTMVSLRHGPPGWPEMLPSGVHSMQRVIQHLRAGGLSNRSP